MNDNDCVTECSCPSLVIFLLLLILRRRGNALRLGAVIVITREVINRSMLCLTRLHARARYGVHVGCSWTVEPKESFFVFFCS